MNNKTYEFSEGTLVKHFDNGITYYTIIKNGVESKKYRTAANATKQLFK